jgi:hypothetical protein
MNLEKLMVMEPGDQRIVKRVCRALFRRGIEADAVY